MKKRGFLSQKHTIIFYEKRAEPPFFARTTKRHKKHTRERRCFPFRLTPLRRRRFLRSERPSRTRACPGACDSANDVSLFTRNFVSFFFFFLNIFSPLFWVCKWNREEGEALWMWSLSLVGCASRVGIDRSDRERRKRERGRRVVLLLFFGRTDAFARCSIERGGVLIPSSSLTIMWLIFFSYPNGYLLKRALIQCYLRRWWW